MMPLTLGTDTERGPVALRAVIEADSPLILDTAARLPGD